jgi:hypothetical protein
MTCRTMSVMRSTEIPQTLMSPEGRGSFERRHALVHQSVVAFCWVCPICCSRCRYQSSSLASLHVLPAFQDFVAFASAMEEALLATSAELGGDLEALQ